jgi:hypothetical protein
MKTFLKNLWDSVKKKFESIRYKTKKLVPVAIHVVEGLKEAMDNPASDVLLQIIKRAIPGTADDLLIDKITRVIREQLPRVLLDLKMMESVANMEDQNEQLKAVIAQLKLSSDQTKLIIYHGIASLILECLADGELSWSDCIAITEYYYQMDKKQAE